MNRFEFSLFDRFIPLMHLSGKDRKMLEEHTELVSYEKGQTIFIGGDNNNKTCYLCHGEIEATATDGRRMDVTAGSEASRHPLSDIFSGYDTARAIRDSSVLMIDRGRLNDLAISSGADDAGGERSQIREQWLVISEIQEELEELKNKLGRTLAIKDEIKQSIETAGRKTGETIKREYRLVETVMNKALSIYEDSRQIKGRLLEDRIELKKLLENQKKQHDDTIRSIENEAQLRISGELKKIEEYYSVKENQIRQLQKLKSIADKRLQSCWKTETSASEGKGAEQDSDSPSGSRPANGNEHRGRKVDIDALNNKLKYEFEKRTTAGVSVDGDITEVPDEADDSMDRELRHDTPERVQSGTSGEQLRKLREKQEISRRIYRSAIKNKKPSQFEDS